MVARSLRKRGLGGLRLSSAVAVVLAALCPQAWHVIAPWPCMLHIIHLWANLQFLEPKRHPPRCWKYRQRLIGLVTFDLSFAFLTKSLTFRSSSFSVIVSANLRRSKCTLSWPHLNRPCLLRLPNPATTEFNSGFSSLLAPVAFRTSWTKSRSSPCWRRCSVTYFAIFGLQIWRRDSGGIFPKTFTSSATVV